MIFRSTLLTLGLCFAAQQADAKPNVLVIMADNLGTNDVPGYWENGKSSSIMQAVQRELIDKGILFTDAHATPMGWASRYSFLSGNYPHRGRLVGGVAKPNYIGNQFLAGQNSIAKTFQDAGYETFMAGSYLIGGKLPLKKKNKQDTGVMCTKTTGNVKHACHLTDDRHDWTKDFEGGPKDIGFDSSHISLTGNYAGPYAWMTDGQFSDPKNGNVDMTTIADMKNISTNTDKDEFPEKRKYESKYIWTANDVSNDWDPRWENFEIYEKTEDFLRNRDRTKPFFSYLALKSVGSPEYDSAKTTVNAVSDNWLNDDNEGERCLAKNRDWNCPQRLGPLRAESKHETNIKEVELMVRWLIKTLEEKTESGESDIENTIIVFTSDSGSGYYNDLDSRKLNSNGKFKGAEGDIFEGGHRVPLIIRWDKGLAAQKGKRRGRTYSITDLYRTLAGLAGVQVAEGQAVDSKNMSGYLSNATYFKKQSNKEDKRTYLGSWVVDPLYGLKYESMRWKGLKLIRNMVTGTWQLFNVTTDKEEAIDIYPKADESKWNYNKGTLGQRIKKLKKKLDRVAMCRDNDNYVFTGRGEKTTCKDFTEKECSGDNRDMEVYYNCGETCASFNDNNEWCFNPGTLIENEYLEKYGMYYEEGTTNEAAMRMYTPAGYKASGIDAENLKPDFLQAIDPDEETIWYWDDEDDDDDDDETATSAAPIITGTSQLVAGLATFFLTIIL